MAPIKAVLRSKLDKADTDKTSLMELVDKYEEILSDASSTVSSTTDSYQPGSEDSELDTGVAASPMPSSLQLPHQHLPQTSFNLPTLFARPASSASAAEPTAYDELEAQNPAQQQYFQLLGNIIFQQILQQHQQHQLSAAAPLCDEQPLNLSPSRGSVNPLKRSASQTFGEQTEDHLLAQADAAATLPPSAANSPALSATAKPSPRKRKRSYRLSDNEEIRVYQMSAPELFEWNGHKPMIHQFLLKLLNNPSCSSLIRWLDRETRLFKVLQPGMVARLWQFIKGNRTDNYECFARGIRHSRDIGKYFEAHDLRKKKVYKFAEKALRPVSAAEAAAAAADEFEESESSAAKARLGATDKMPTAAEHRPTRQAETNEDAASVRAKLKSALAERMLQQQQLRQQEVVADCVKDEPCCDDSPLMIADCDHLTS